MSPILFSHQLSKYASMYPDPIASLKPLGLVLKYYSAKKEYLTDFMEAATFDNVI